MDPNKPAPFGDRNTSSKPDVVPGSPWQEDEIWEAPGPGVVPMGAASGRDAADEIRDEARGAKERVKEGARDMGRMAAEKSAQAGQKIREFGSRALSDQKERAAEEVGHVSSAVRKAADKLHEERDENLAEYVEAAAEQLDRAERYLRNRPLDAMYGDLQDFARRRPEMLVGGMFVVGVALSRFLKAGRPERASRFTTDYQPSGRAAAGPLVTATGEPITPNYPPSRPTVDLVTPASIKTSTPEVK